MKVDIGEEYLSIQEKMYIIFCFLLCFAWSCVFLNDGYGPDEVMRFAIPKYIYETGTLPKGWEPSLINDIWGFSYGFFLSLPYLTSALFMKIASFIAKPDYPLLIAARFSSVLSYTGIAFYAVRIGKKALSHQAKWVFVFLMTLTPQIVFLGTYTNLDSFALFTVMMLLDAWIDCMDTDWNRRSSVKLGLAMGLCFLSYHFAYGYIVGSFLLYCFWYVKHHSTVSFSRFLRNGFLVLGIVFLISGWVFIRNGILYDGDVFAFRIRQIYGEKYAAPGFKPSQHITPLKEGYSILGMLRNTDWIGLTLKSAVSMLGYMVIVADPWVYRGFAVLYLVGGACGMIHVFPKHTKDLCSDRTLLLLASLIASLVTLGLSLYYSWAVDYQAQGRYVLYAMPPVALIVSRGLEWLAEKISCTMERSEFFQRVSVRVIGVFLMLCVFEAFIHCVVVFLPNTFTSG